MTQDTPSIDLGPLLDPRGIVLVGASDRNAFSRSAFANLQTLGYRGGIHLVSRGGGMAHGRQTLALCADITEPVDVALVMVPIAAIDGVLRDVARCGARFAIVLAGGFAEVGDAGRALQDAMVRTARELGITLLGPNCLGYINFSNGAACWTGSMRTPPLAGSVSMVSQSGAIATFAKHFAHQQGIGLHAVVSTGNEAMLDLASVADALLDDPGSKAVALFIETVRDPQRFRAMAARALALGKPLIALKVGRSEITQAAAQSHTGAMVGDDAVFDGVCQQYGITRVRSIEELVFTSALMARLGVLDGSGIGFMSVSGGMGELGADYAHLEGLTLPAFAPHTLAALRAALPPYASPANPLDLTGAAINEPSLYTQSLAAVSADPGVALTVCIADVPTGLNDDWTPHFVRAVEEIGRAAAGATRPIVVISHTSKYVSDKARDVIAAAGLPYVSSGTDLGMRAVRHAIAWSRRMSPSPSGGGRGGGQRKASAVHVGPHPSLPPEGEGARPESEWQATRHLIAFDVPVVPSVLAATSAEAVAAATAMSGPVVLKIASPDIAHKTEVGGVKLRLVGADAVRDAADAIFASVAQHAPQARIEGVLVAPMRGEGVELFVGVRHDPQWGHVIALGLGGVWIEALKDASLRLLPIGRADVLEMLAGLRGAVLLDGFRGAAPVDREALATIVARIGDAALALGPTLDTFEVNPLLAAGSRIEVLDALATYRDTH